VSPEAGHRLADPRLPAYLIAGFGALLAAIATGQAVLAALAAPFLALAALGLRGHGRSGHGRSGLTGSVELATERAIEGDVVEGAVHVEWQGEAEIDVLLAGWHGVAPVDPAPVIGWSLALGRGPASLPFRVRAQSWGAHDLGALWVRVRRPGSLIVWEQKLATGSGLRVLPSPLRLDRLLKPAEPRAVSGAHLARDRGHGTDFAELRPYRPGDRLRDISWATSARLGTLWVAVHHPERTGTVLLLLDAFVPSDRTARESLARAARAAWAVASAHLQAQDRVGLLAQGRSTAWLPPRGGRRARWMLLDELLAVGGDAENRRPRRLRARAVVPPDALVVGITGLRWPWFIGDLLHHRRAGRATVALVIDTSDLVPEGEGAADAAARRLWRAQREAERQRLERGGVPTVLVTESGGVAPAISSLRRRMSSWQATRAAVRAR
jgi:uncharacterized protein (DUF58 family)